MIILTTTKPINFKETCFGIKYLGYVINELFAIRSKIGIMFKIIGFYIERELCERVEK